MKDRLKFKETKLRNGITIYSAEEDLPFLEMEIMIPVGSSHNVEKNNGLNGMAHFLEHAIFERSEKYPEKKQFEKFVTLSGGYLNARTGPKDTSFEASIPSSLAEKTIEGFIDHIFHPIFDAADFKLHRGIISDERNKKVRYYPGHNEIDHYLLTKWMDSKWYPLEQTFGSDEDLRNITPESIKMFHKHYFNNEIKVIVAGKFDLGHLKKHFSTIETRKVTLVEKYSETKWKKKKFHSSRFKDISSPVYITGGIINKKLNLTDEIAFHFILEALTNTSQGSIYQWVREEKGWSYYVNDFTFLRPSGFLYGLEIPIPDKKALSVVKKELEEKILDTLNNKEFIDREVNRQIYKSLFYYQKISDRINSASVYLSHHKRIIAQKEYFGELEKCRDIDYIMKIYRKYLAKDTRGEFLALPL